MTDALNVSFANALIPVPANYVETDPKVFNKFQLSAIKGARKVTRTHTGLLDSENATKKEKAEAAMAFAKSSDDELKTFLKAVLTDNGNNNISVSATVMSEITAKVKSMASAVEMVVNGNNDDGIDFKRVSIIEKLKLVLKMQIDPINYSVGNPPIVFDKESGTNNEGATTMRTSAPDVFISANRIMLIYVNKEFLSGLKDLASNNTSSRKAAENYNITSEMVKEQTTKVIEQLALNKFTKKSSSTPKHSASTKKGRRGSSRKNNDEVFDWSDEDCE